MSWFLAVYMAYRLGKKPRTKQYYLDNGKAGRHDKQYHYKGKIVPLLFVALYRILQYIK
jgi:hypothetical protein